ncbi:hypothetical protein N9C32_00930 [Flavobacteriaceae bacterium]|jgi:hypothetical protein|nr:hypothetical protein [Flavobacteriaceae bacterium]MDA9276055.1 hypothetical protein [Flavobacteriaceae bacterium]MDA9850640.1 hypothetical protein [Flavobacteriaceae bacterium]MDC0560123.1 hypothetical protein [Flavobacteriaceae bacterium]MDC0879201.1 hypothetical protein [Flavobacteriaceae bacterium]|tara:strand:- start:45 stop:713 length:669 start_codon:yes stop_codon:yes gene_type:complete
MKNFIINFSSSFKFTLLTIVALLSPNISYSQDFGADLVSSYVWRGAQFGSGAHIQPYMDLGSGNLTGGVWGSFPTSAKGGGNELDLWVSYDFGPLALTVTNYTFPGEGGVYADGEGLFNGDYTELAASTSIMGVDLSAGYFTEVEALYVELGFSTGAVDIAFGYGDDQADGFYAGGGSGLVNMSFSGSKDIQISDNYALPVFGSFIINPEAETAFLVFGISF